MAQEDRTVPPLADLDFIANVREARDNGFDMCCSDCGVGITDSSDEHDLYCPRHPDVKEKFARARRYNEALAAER